MDFGRGQALPGSGGLGAEEPTRARRQIADLAQQAPHGIRVPHGTQAPHGIGQAPQGTTVVAVTFDGGVLIAGDRRAISGSVISRRDVETVFVADAYSAVGVTGTAGLATEMVRTYQAELSQYEKLEGVPLSLPAKTNRLAALVRGDFGAALPLFVGFDLDADDPARAGRIVSFDEAGGRYEERGGFHGVGSGALFACAALKKLWDQGSDEDAAVRVAIAALCDAAESDAATGGPDLARGIYPNIITITAAEGAVHLPEDKVAEVTESVVTARDNQPRG
jgi:proteasome beta subunit